MSTPTPQRTGQEGKEAPHPIECPITGRKYWGHMIHPKHGNVPLYGGPFDSYMIPVRVGDVGPDDEWEVERYDQDRGEWMTEGFL
jgi:hypothetical protein